MNRSRLTGLVIAALLVIGIASYLSTRRNAAHETRDALLFPALAGELSTLSSIDVLKGSATPTVSLRKKGGQWTVVQRADYPADVAKLRKLLLSVSDAKIIEEKTSDPANYASIGVDDPAKAESTGTQLDFSVKDGTHSLIVGKPSGADNFVRRGGEKTSYLVAPAIYVEFEPRLWIETKLLDIPADQIERVDYRPASGGSYAVHRVVAAAAPASAPAASGAASSAAPQLPEFVLEGVPAGRTAADSPTLTPSSAVFGSLSADDVASASDIDFSKPATTTVTLKDGSKITFIGSVVGDKHWIQIQAPKDEALMGRIAGRAVRIAGYRYDGLFRPLEQLLVPKPAPPEKNSKQPAAKQSPRTP